MADLSDLKVQLTLSLTELEQVVALLNFADENMQKAGFEPNALVGELSTMYFDTMEQLNDGNLGDFEPE